MIEFELDIPSLTDEGIQISYAFHGMKEFICSSMIDGLIMIEMLILLINSFDKIVNIFRAVVDNKVIVSCSMDSLCLFECSCLYESG